MMEKQLFVIQRHSRGQEVHWDLMLERGEVLVTWQVGVEPGQWADRQWECKKLFDHRRKYLTYEGPVSGNRGEVQIAAQGNYQVRERKKTFWSVWLEGDTICGNLEIRKVRDEIWNLSFKEQVHGKE
jgi:hypothetical protein